MILRPSMKDYNKIIYKSEPNELDHVPYEDYHKVEDKDVLILYSKGISDYIKGK